MADDVAGDVGGDAGLDGGDGSFEGGEPADGGVDIAAVEASYNADALAKLGIEPAPGTKEDGSATPAQAAEKRRIDAFIEKNYGGDEDAFLAAQYSQREEAKRLASTVRELQEAIKNPPAPRDVQAEIANALQLHPKAQSIDRRMSETDTDIKQIDREQAQLATEAGQINNKLGELNARMQVAPEEQRAELWAQINRAENRMSVINSEWKANAGLKRTNISLLQTLQDQREDLAERIQGQLRSQEEQSRSESANADRVRSNFDQSFEAIASQAGIDPESDLGKTFGRVVRSQVADHLDTLPNGLDPAGLYKATQTIANTLMKQLGINPRAAGRPGVKPPITPRQTLVPRRAFNASGQPYAPPVTSAGDPLDNPNLTPKQRADLARGQARAIGDAITKQARRGALA